MKKSCEKSDRVRSEKRGLKPNFSQEENVCVRARARVPLTPLCTVRVCTCPNNPLVVWLCVSNGIYL